MIYSILLICSKSCSVSLLFLSGITPLSFKIAHNQLHCKLLFSICPKSCFHSTVFTTDIPTKGSHFNLFLYLTFNICSMSVMLCEKLGAIKISNFPRPTLDIRACVLSHFSHVQFFASLWTVTRQTPLSIHGVF